MGSCPWCGRPNCHQCERERAMEELHGVPEDHIDAGDEDGDSG